ncbi:KxYKxGKxW signal peptide domain-containing protein, partial [Enterococcus faecalis]|nr:KxYKxGKxW signal peptide domain-containing protein [Enterococcus faecalis]
MNKKENIEIKKRFKMYKVKKKWVIMPIVFIGFATSLCSGNHSEAFAERINNYNSNDGVALRSILFSDFKIDINSSRYDNNKLIVDATLLFNSSLINTINLLANNTHSVTIDIPKNVADALVSLKVDGVAQSNFNQVKLTKKTGLINGTLSKSLNIPLDLTFDLRKMGKNSGTIDVFDKSVGTIWGALGGNGTEYKANIPVEKFYNDIADDVSSKAIQEVKKQDMLTNSIKDKYIEKINKANSIPEIIEQVEKSIKENEDTRKAQAKVDIDAAAAKVKGEIDADGTLTAEEKGKQKANVDQEAEKAKGAI